MISVKLLASTILLLADVVLIGAAPTPSEVLLRVNITATKLILHCEVPASGIGTTTHLYCPLTGRSPCFEDCVRSCILVGGRCLPLEALKTTYCSRQQIEGTIITSYTLDAKDRKNIGEWYCVHGGKRSSGFYLNVDEKSTTTPVTTTMETTTFRTTSTTTTTAPVPIVSQTSPHISPYEGKGRKPELMPAPKEEGGNELIKQLTRPDLVIAILSLLALSLIVNLAFCIRCILVRKYIELQRDGGKDSACLSACLCISRAQPNRPPPKAPRDCIYEEITTSPAGLHRARRPSNCSSTQRTFSTSLDGVHGATPVPGDMRGSFQRRGSMPRSRTFPVKAVALPTQGLHQRPSYIYVAATENGMLLEPVLSPSSRVSSQQLYDDVASDVHSLAASTNAIYAKVQKASQQLHHRQQQQLVGQQQQRAGSLPPPLAEQQEDELTPLTGSPVHSAATRPGSAGTGTGSGSGAKCGTPSVAGEGERGRASVSPGAELDLTADCTRNNSRLELSKSLLQKADTLLREAGCLLD